MEAGDGRGRVDIGAVRRRQREERGGAGEEGVLRGEATWPCTSGLGVGDPTGLGRGKGQTRRTRRDSARVPYRATG